MGRTFITHKYITIRKRHIFFFGLVVRAETLANTLLSLLERLVGEVVEVDREMNSLRRWHEELIVINRNDSKHQ